MIYTNFSLKSFNTFGLDHRADFFITLKSEEEAIQFIKTSNRITGPVLVLGEGSNLLFTSDFHGTIIHPLIEGITIEEEKPDYVIISAGAGINWDKFVEWCVNKGYRGIENLSYIPGTVGATPVQNIGAYGVEVKDVIYKVKAISLSDGRQKEFTSEECRFGYRDSIFKNEIKGKNLITRVFFRLSLNAPFVISYGNLKDEIEKTGSLSLENIRQTVINIRRSKLPDPAEIGNAGSFFRNPLVSPDEAQYLKVKYPSIPCFTDPSGSIKLSAAWLIEQCGWKGKRIGDAGVHEKHALVLVNYGKATGEEIFNLSEKIRESVYQKFGISLEREVEVIGENNDLSF